MSTPKTMDEVRAWANRLSDAEVEQYERDLAVLAGQAPRGWIPVEGGPPFVGRVRSDGMVHAGMTVVASRKHETNIDVTMALSRILNVSGKLLMEVRRTRDNTPLLMVPVPVTEDDDEDPYLDTDDN